METELGFSGDEWILIKKGNTVYEKWEEFPGTGSRHCAPPGWWQDPVAGLWAGMRLGKLSQRLCSPSQPGFRTGIQYQLEAKTLPNPHSLSSTLLSLHRCLLLALSLIGPGSTQGGALRTAILIIIKGYTKDWPSDCLWPAGHAFTDVVIYRLVLLWWCYAWVISGFEMP